MGFLSRDLAIRTLQDLEKEVKGLKAKADEMDSTEFYLAFDRIKRKFESAESMAFEAWLTNHAAEAMPAEEEEAA